MIFCFLPTYTDKSYVLFPLESNLAYFHSDHIFVGSDQWWTLLSPWASKFCKVSSSSRDNIIEEMRSEVEFAFSSESIDHHFTYPQDSVYFQTDCSKHKIFDDQTVCSWSKTWIPFLYFVFPIFMLIDIIVALQNNSIL